MTNHTTDRAPEEPQVPLSERVTNGLGPCDLAGAGLGCAKTFVCKPHREAREAFAALEARNRHLEQVVKALRRIESLPRFASRNEAGVEPAADLAEAQSIARSALRTLDGSEGE